MMDFESNLTLRPLGTHPNHEDNSAFHSITRRQHFSTLNDGIAAYSNRLHAVTRNYKMFLYLGPCIYVFVPKILVRVRIGVHILT